MPDPGGAPVALKATRLTTTGAPAKPRRATVDRRRPLEPVTRDIILARSEWLHETERDLVGALYRHGHTTREVARAAGVPFRNLYKRTARILQRLTHRHFAYVLTHQQFWSGELRGVAVLCILRGASVREAARTLGLTYHSARRSRDLVLRMADAAHAASLAAHRREVAP